MFKALVSAACIAVIAFVGFFFFERWSEQHHRTQQAERDLEFERSNRCETAAANWKYFEDRGYSMVSNDPARLLLEAIACGHTATDDDRQKVKAAIEAADAPIPELR